MLITKVDYRSSSSPSSHVVSCYRLVTNFQETNRQQETHARRDERTVISELHPISYSYCGWSLPSGPPVLEAQNQALNAWVSSLTASTAVKPPSLNDGVT